MIGCRESAGTMPVSYTHLHGIKLVLGYTVEGFKGKDNGVEILLKDNPSLQADMVDVYKRQIFRILFL